MQFLLFADDTVLIIETEEDLEHNIIGTGNSSEGAQVGSKLDKTNTMIISTETAGCKVEVEGHSVKNVREVVYLEVKVELERRLGIATRTVGAMKECTMQWWCK